MCLRVYAIVHKPLPILTAQNVFIALRHLPNLLTMARIFLVPWIVIDLLNYHYDRALALLLLAGLSDALDGYLARRFGWQTRLGGLLDPLADKLLFMALFFTFGWMGDLPLWLVLLALGRDVLILGGALAYHVRVGPLEAEPLLISKLNTALQLALVAVVLINHGAASVGLQMWLPRWLFPALEWTLVATLFASGAAYVKIWSTRARAAQRKAEL